MSETQVSAGVIPSEGSEGGSVPGPPPWLIDG